MSTYSPGSIVKCREREWVVVPIQDNNVLLLRPLAGTEKELCGIYLPLGIESIEPAVFPLPNPDQVSDHASGLLLRDAARLVLRSGAGPFRSMGRISVEPRPYQLVPLIMALRLNPIRLLLADDVGVGKTIEAALIARELLDRGEIERLVVVCPPQLCDQWQEELKNKFHIEAEVVRAGTAARLERGLPQGDHSIFSYYRHLIVSVDYVKSEKHRHSFLQHCPEFVIVDEAHTCAKPPGQKANQQQRYELLLKLAEKTERHLLLLTATPHSGFEESFLSLLALLNSKFNTLNLSQITRGEKSDLALHFIQRQRVDVKRWLGEETPFPERDSSEEAYELSKEYAAFFNKVYEFAHEMVKTGETLSGWKQRVRYWAALALLRCVMSSPAAAEAALKIRLDSDRSLSEPEEDDFSFKREVYDLTEVENISDGEPLQALEQGGKDLPESGKRRLHQFIQEAGKLKGGLDQKIQKTIQIIENLLKEKFHPIVYCRYIATAQYVADALQKAIGSKFKELRILAVTGEDPDELREERVRELSTSSIRVLVATDCLSEGVNLQDDFDAVIHYDLPWNPNRLEQREGRVDRFGQKAKKVKAILLYGSNNPIDGAVLNVLIRKAVKIHKTLGITVPLPIDSETVMETVLKSLFMRAKKVEQLTLFDLNDQVSDIHHKWERSAQEEKESRSRFAQKWLKPEEVEEELKETHAVLGETKTVESFVRSACERLGAPLEKNGDGWKILVSAFPLPLREKLQSLNGKKITFQLPAPEGFIPVGRNHFLVESLANYLMETALDSTIELPTASRCGVIRTDQASEFTAITLFRIRFLLKSPETAPLLAEEILLSGWKGKSNLLKADEALALLETTIPRANLTKEEKKYFIQEALTQYQTFSHQFESLAFERAKRLEASHQRVRKVIKVKPVSAHPQLPVDLLGLYVFVPIPGGTKR